MEADLLAPVRAPEEIRRPPFLMRTAMALALALGLALLIGYAVAGAEPFAFDRIILRALRTADPAVPVGPGWLLHAMRDITAMGGGTVLTLVVVATVGMLLVSRHALLAAIVALATVTGSGTVGLLKNFLARARPDVVPHLADVTTLSFPSGHAANSAIIYLTVATLLTQVVHDRIRRTYLFVLAALLVTLIGFSRLYLGVHWPSDVLAGWCFGTLWAIGWWRAAAWARTRRGAALLDDQAEPGDL